MSQAAAPPVTFASGRYSKRKRTQVNYRMQELDVDETDFESEEEAVQPKVRRTSLDFVDHTKKSPEATQDCSMQASSKAQDFLFPQATC